MTVSTPWAPNSSFLSVGWLISKIIYSASDLNNSAPKVVLWNN